jgi:hypothetical protein
MMKVSRLLPIFVKVPYLLGFIILASLLVSERSVETLSVFRELIHQEAAVEKEKFRFIQLLESSLSFPYIFARS